MKLKNNHIERIVLNDKCNFNCKYCYQTNKQNLSIDLNILEKRLKFLKEQLDNKTIEKLFLSIFGGEPLLEKERIKLIFKYLKDYPNINFQITTNGFLFDEEYFSLFNDIKNNLEITISLDGREQGNLNRCSEEQTKKIISNVKYLIKNNFNINLFTCINNQNKNYLFEDLKYFIEVLKIQDIDLFFVGCGNMNYNSCDLSLGEKKKILKEIFPLCQKYSNIINTKNDYFINAYFKQLDYNQTKIESKSPTQTYVWVFQPNGFVYSYYTETGVNIDDNKQFQITDKIENLNELNIHKIINYNLEEIEIKEIQKEDYLINKIYENLYKLKPYEIKSVYLLVDESCNLNCSYCYEKNKLNGRISLQQVPDFLNYLNNNYLCETIILFGGEPTLNTEVCIKILEEAPEEIYVSMSTNGIIFNEKLVEAFAKRTRAWLQVSLDGEFESMRERLGDNKELFNTIVSNSKKYSTMLKEKRKDKRNIFNFHSTLTNENLKYLYDNIKFLIDLNLAHRINITPDFTGNWSKTDLFLYKAQLELLINYLEKEYKNKNKFIPYINTFNLSTQEGLHQSRYACCAGVESFEINHKGDIYPCVRLYTTYGDKFLMGSIYDNKPVKRIFANIDMNKSNPSSCGKCTLPNCVRCYAANLEQTGKLDVCNLNQCEIIKINLELNKKIKEKFGEKGLQNNG